MARDGGRYWPKKENYETVIFAETFAAISLQSVRKTERGSKCGNALTRNGNGFDRKVFVLIEIW